MIASAHVTEKGVLAMGPLGIPWEAWLVMLLGILGYAVVGLLALIVLWIVVRVIRSAWTGN